MKRWVDRGWRSLFSFWRKVGMTHLGVCFPPGRSATCPTSNFIWSTPTLIPEPKIPPRCKTASNRFKPNSALSFTLDPILLDYKRLHLLELSPSTGRRRRRMGATFSSLPILARMRFTRGWFGRLGILWVTIPRSCPRPRVNES